ncbi:MAG: type 4a pilus biogenesis protein PilO [bacterium]|nr:type 4a pilus biogenesis protein PilO [bacterium]
MGFAKQLEAIPSSYRWAIIPAILLLLGASYWYFLYQPAGDKIARVERQVAGKRKTLDKHRKIAEQYDAFKAKVDELQDQLRIALIQLPSRKEIPDLIRQISDLGVRTGLQISLLRPQPEHPKEFYAEVPITVKVVGDYHSVGQFFDALGRLPRIVSVSNVQMSVKNAKEAAILETQCLATTFRFFEGGEGEVADAASNGGKRKR